MKKTLGQFIRELRDKKDISLRELARKADISAPFLSDVELGRRNPSEHNLRRIAELLDADYEELKSYDSRPPIEEMKQKTAANPAYGAAFRKVVNSNLSPDELMEAINQKEQNEE